jgi:hypothetical protein
VFTSRGWFLPASAILRGQNLRYTLWLLVYVYFIDTVDNMHLNISVLADLLAVIVFIAIIVPGLRNSFSPMYNTSSYVPLRGQHHRFIRPLSGRLVLKKLPQGPSCRTQDSATPRFNSNSALGVGRPLEISRKIDVTHLILFIYIIFSTAVLRCLACMR